MTPERWQEIEKFYHLAHERGREVPEEADSEVRRQVELLLAQDSGGKLLDEAPRLPDERPATPLQCGSQLGPYKIEDVLGAGGMGQVYRARDTRAMFPLPFFSISPTNCDGVCRSHGTDPTCRRPEAKSPKNFRP